MSRSRASSNKDKLLTSVLAVLASHSSASMVDVANQLGVGRTTLYRHFTSYEVMVSEVALLGAKLFGDALLRAQPAEGSGLAAVERICVELFSIPDVLTLMFADNPIITDEVFAQADKERRAAAFPTYDQHQDHRNHGTSNDPLEEVILRGQQDGSITTQVPAQWAAMYVFLTIGSGHLFSLAGESYPVANSRDQSLDLTIRAVKATLSA